MSAQMDRVTHSFRPGLRSFWRRLRRDTRGVTAVEFSLLALPFFAMIMAVMEVAFIFMTTIDLENAVRDASRTIRTGQIQSENKTAADFREEICKHVAMVSDCSTNGDLTIDVRTYDNFGTIQSDESDPVNDNTFDPGSGGEVVLVRVYYLVNFISAVRLLGLENAGSGKHRIEAISLFRNEPFS
jgi:Flp pilus assembly protein TadG